MTTTTATTTINYGRTFTAPITTPTRSYMIQFVPAGSRPIMLWGNQYGQPQAAAGIVLHDLTYAEDDKPLGQPLTWGPASSLLNGPLYPFGWDQGYIVGQDDIEALQAAYDEALDTNPYIAPAADLLDSVREGVNHGHNERLRVAARALRGMVAAGLMTGEEAVAQLDEAVPGREPSRTLVHEALLHA